MSLKRKPVSEDKINKAIENYFKDGNSFPNENITKKKINNIGLEIFRVCYFGFLAAISFSIAAFSYMGASLQLFEMTLPLKAFIGFSIVIGVFIALITIALFLRCILKGSKYTPNYKIINGENEKIESKEEENELQKHKGKLLKEIEGSIEKWGYLFKDLEKNPLRNLEKYCTYEIEAEKLKKIIKIEKINIRDAIKDLKKQNILLKNIIKRKKNFSIQIESLAKLIEEENPNKKQFFQFFLKVFDELVKNSSYSFMDILVFSARVLKNKITKMNHKKYFLIKKLYPNFMKKLNNKKKLYPNFMKKLNNKKLFFYGDYFDCIENILLEEKMVCVYLIENFSSYAIKSAMREIIKYISEIHSDKELESY